METCHFVESSPQEKVFRIPLIFDCILEQMDFEGLKNLRLVCKSWQLAADSEILKRPGIKLEFVWDKSEDSINWKRGRYRLANNNNPVWAVEVQEESQEKYLSDLNVILKSSTSFPCRHFFFKNGNMNDRTCKTFFGNHGRNIETLRTSRVEISEKTLQRMLSKDLPNLKRLSLSLSSRCSNAIFHWSEWEDDKKFYDRTKDNLKLPSLEILHFDHRPHYGDFRGPVARRIIKAAINLKSLANPCLFSFFKVRSSLKDKVYLIKEFRLSLYTTQFEDFQQFVSANPLLKILNTEGYRHCPETMNTLMAQLLLGCSETLEILRTDTFSLLPLKIEMKRLTHLFLEHASNDEHFPVAAISKFCPGLKFIRFKYTRYFKNIEDYFNVSDTHAASLTSVTHLEFYRGDIDSTAFLVRINLLFPKLKEFSITGQPTSVSQISEIFEKLQELKWIHLALGTNQRVSRSEWFNSVLEGRAKDYVKWDRNQKPQMFKFYDEDLYPREEPEIFHI